MRSKLAVSVSLAALVVVLGACSRSSTKSAAMAPSDAGERVGIASGTNNAAASAPGGASHSRTASVDLADAKRPDGSQIIHNATEAMQAADVDAALDRVTTVVQAAGGDILSADAQLADPDTRHIHATFEVPPDQFDAVLHKLAGIGKITSNQVSTQDVTGQVVDLDARLAAARTSADRLRALLAQTANVNDLLQVEQQLSQRESDVESLASQDNAIHAQVAHATITVEISPTPKPAPVPPKPHRTHPSFGRGLSTGVEAFVGGGRVALTAVGFALPFVAIAIVLGVPAFLIRRRRRTAIGGPDPVTA
jgi:hypothetical protein